MVETISKQCVKRKNTLTESQFRTMLDEYYLTDIPNLVIAKLIGVRGQRVVDYFKTKPDYKDRQKRLYRLSKLGDRNPMTGKVGTLHHNYHGECLDGKGYLTMVTPVWYTKPSKRVFVHHVNYCLVHGLTRVPEGYHIHHVDHNPLNNNPNNLVMLTPSQHAKLHHQEASND